MGEVAFIVMFYTVMLIVPGMTGRMLEEPVVDSAGLFWLGSGMPALAVDCDGRCRHLCNSRAGRIQRGAGPCPAQGRRSPPGKTDQFRALVQQQSFSNLNC